METCREQALKCKAHFPRGKNRRLHSSLKNSPVCLGDNYRVKNNGKGFDKTRYYAIQ